MICVLPSGFYFLADVDGITPLRPNLAVIYADGFADAIAVLARLNPGVTASEAEAEMNPIRLADPFAVSLRYSA